MLRVVKGGHAFFDFIDQNGSIKCKIWRAEEQGLLPALQGDDPILCLGSLEIDTWNGRNDVSSIVEDVMRVEPTKPARRGLDYASMLSA
jgi:hypothetical protein